MYSPDLHQHETSYNGESGSPSSQASNRSNSASPSSRASNRGESGSSSQASNRSNSASPSPQASNRSNSRSAEQEGSDSTSQDQLFCPNNKFDTIANTVDYETIFDLLTSFDPLTQKHTDELIKHVAGSIYFFSPKDEDKIGKVVVIKIRKSI